MGIINLIDKTQQIFKDLAKIDYEPKNPFYQQFLMFQIINIGNVIKDNGLNNKKNARDAGFSTPVCNLLFGLYTLRNYLLHGLQRDSVSLLFKTGFPEFFHHYIKDALEDTSTNKIRTALYEYNTLLQPFFEASKNREGLDHEYIKSTATASITEALELLHLDFENKEQFFRDLPLMLPDNFRADDPLLWGVLQYCIVAHATVYKHEDIKLNDMYRITQNIRRQRVTSQHKAEPFPMDAIRKNIVLILQISEPRDLLQSHEKIDQRFTTMLNKFERGETSPVFEEIYLEDFGMTTVERPSPFPQTSFYPVMNPLNYNRFAFHQPLSPIQPPQGSVVQKNDIKVLSDYQQSNQQLKDNHERMLLELTGTANIVFAFQKEIAQKDEKIAEIKNRLETLQTGQAEESSAHSQLELAQSDSIVQQMEKELKILKNESGQLNKKYDSMKQNFHSQITALNLENKELKNQNKMLRTTNKEVNKRYTDVCTTLSDRNRTISDLEKDIKGQNNQIQASEQNQIQSADQISVLTEQLQQAEAKNQQNRLLICAMLVGMLGMLLYNAAALFSGDTVDTSKGLTLNM